jgi:hypothetical protein
MTSGGSDRASKAGEAQEFEKKLDSRETVESLTYLTLKASAGPEKGLMHRSLSCR